MSGEKPALTPLELRKRMLIAESEINRADLCQECEAIAGGFRSFADRAKTISSYASVAAALVAGFTAFQRSKSTPGEEKRPWVQTVLNGLRLAASVWLAFRARHQDED
jgi:hypothetical protein